MVLYFFTLISASHFCLLQVTMLSKLESIWCTTDLLLSKSLHRKAIISDFSAGLRHKNDLSLTHVDIWWGRVLNK